MEHLHFADLHAYELKFNSLQAASKTTRPRNGKSYQRYPKPPYTYTGLIVMAIQTSPNQKLTLGDIHESLGKMFPFFRDSRYTGWKDSVRHNLSHHTCFEMELKDPTRKTAKGNFWKVDMTKVTPEIFKRQQTSVARGGNYAMDLHEQLGLPPLMISKTSPIPLPAVPISQRRKRKLQEKDHSTFSVEFQPPKRHQPFSIADILRTSPTAPQMYSQSAYSDLKHLSIPTHQLKLFASPWNQSLTPQSEHGYQASPEDSGYCGSSTSTSPKEPAQHSLQISPTCVSSEPREIISEALDLSFPDIQWPSFDGLSTLPSITSPRGGELYHREEHPINPNSYLSDLPPCSGGSNQLITYDHWAKKSYHTYDHVTGYQAPRYQPEIPSGYSYGHPYCVPPAFVKQEGY